MQCYARRADNLFCLAGNFQSTGSLKSQAKLLSFRSVSNLGEVTRLAYHFPLQKHHFANAVLFALTQGMATICLATAKALQAAGGGLTPLWPY